MSLVEAETTGPVEGEDPIVTPPRPLHRRVSVSLLFTLTVLIGTVVTIYLVFDARHNVMLTEALVQARETAELELVAPSAEKLGTWGLGMFGERLPMPPAGIPIVSAGRIELLNRRTAVIRLKIGESEVTYLVQHAKGIVPDQSERKDGELRAVQWASGVFIVAAAGPDATAKEWRAVLHVPNP